MARRRLHPWLAALLLAAVPAAADYPLTILELHHRLPAELIPQLAPLAGPDGVVSGANDVLLVRAAPARLADIRRALAQLDRPARNLLVEVRRIGDSAAHRRGIGVRVDERVGEHGRVILGPGGGTGVSVREASRQRDTRVLQRVRVLDGASAQINVGASTPVRVREGWRTPAGGWQRDTVGAIDTGIGFTATPRLVGERVVVDIHQRDAAWDQGTVTGGSVQTQVSGPLGVWLPLGGTRATDQGAALDISGVGEGSRAALSTLELRVTAVD
jgi:type II secretory pathway component GspD/PulD (secretin)